MIVLLLLLIPVFCVSLSVYISMLYEYAVNTFKIVPMCVSLLLVVVTGYLIPRIFYKLYKSDTPGSLNAEYTMYNLSNYISYIVLLLFGIANLISFIINKNSYLEIYLSGGIIFLFIYITYCYFFHYEVMDFYIDDRVNKNKETDILMMKNSDLGMVQIYVAPKDKYEIGKVYQFRYNKYSKIFKNCKEKKSKK